jgi:hypothetical protein
MWPPDSVVTMRDADRGMPAALQLPRLWCLPAGLDMVALA